MRMEDLRYLIQVADIGSISLAAEACYITQQGLSRIISNLEKELGVKLFHRTNNHIRLTDVGELVVARAKELDGLYQHMLTDISRLSSAEGQRPVDCHIYTTQLISSTLLFRVLSTLNLRYPGIHLNIEELDPPEIADGVAFTPNSVGIINQNSMDGWFPRLFGQTYGLNVLLAIILMVAMYAYLNYTKQGYEIAVVGESENTARYAGIQVKKVIIRTMAISGAICGIAGFVIVSGASHTISTATAGGRGFTAIIVAWLSKFNTFIMVAVSFGIVFMNQGAVQIATQYGLNENASNVLLGIILFFLIGAEFFINYRVKRAKK